MINTLAESVDNFLMKLQEVKTKEKVSWNKGGELYSLNCENNLEKSLFVTYISEDEKNLIDVFFKVCDKGKSDKECYIQCESIYIEDVFEDEKKVGSYVFIIMERITPLINVVLDEKYTDNDTNANRKKEKLLLNIIQAGECIKKINKDFPNINLFINNEEICIDQEYNSKLLLFDMIKNQINTKNQVYELNGFMERIASGLNASINIKSKYVNIQEFINECMIKREKILEKEEKYENKLAENIEAAKGNNPKAFTNLGYMYEKGKGTVIDYEKALFWYKKAAETKYAPAINNLAHMYQKGNGVEKDYEMAVKYLFQAAKLKDSVAWFNLGMAYQRGKGVEKNIKEAINCYKKASKYGNKTAKIMCERLKSKDK